MPQYLALIYGPADIDPSQTDNLQMMKEYDEFGHAAAAVIRGGNALYPASTATTVRVPGGRGADPVTTDGPFAETKEVLGGYFVLECADLDEAVHWAAQIPGAWQGGSVEVRPIVTFA